MDKEEKTIRTVFKEYNEVIQYIKDNSAPHHMIENYQTVMLRDCIFESTIDFDLLLYTLTSTWQQLSRIDFSDSVFKGKVWLHRGRQKEKKDENGKIINIEYFNEDLNIALDFQGVHFMKELSFQSINFLENINFINATFDGRVELQQLNFNKCFRVFGTTFNSDINFAYSTLNTKTVFFTSPEDRPKFKGDVSFWGTTLEDARFWDFIFEKDVDFTNTHFKCDAFFNRAKFSGKLILRSIETMGRTIFNGNLYFDDATIDNLQLENILFETTLSLNSAEINTVKFENVLFVRNPLALSATNIKRIENEYTARILKHEAFKSSNQFLAIEFRAKEMRMHYHKLKWFKEPFEKLAFWLNCKSNTYGLKWEKGVLFTLITWFLFFSWFIISRDGWGDTFIWTDPEYLNEAVSYFWVFNGMQGLSAKTNWYEILPFFLGKIFIAYGIYQTITAFRKHGQNK